MKNISNYKNIKKIKNEMKVLIDEIKVKSRMRIDYGDISTLAQSIKEVDCFFHVLVFVYLRQNRGQVII